MNVIYYIRYSQNTKKKLEESCFMETLNINIDTK